MRATPMSTTFLLDAALPLGTPALPARRSPPMFLTMPLTRNLLALDATKDAYARATHHPFLRAAGQLTLSSPALAAWLTQDRLYALCGYGAFLGLLIARLPAPEAGPGDAHSQQHRRRLTVLAGAMANIDREVGFFEQVAQDNGLDLATQSLDSSADNQSLGLANPITRVRAEAHRCRWLSALCQLYLMLIRFFPCPPPSPPSIQGYIDYMIAVAARGTFEEALVLLWAMEKVRRAPRATS